MPAICAAVGLPKANYYRRLKPLPPRAKRTSLRALGADERRGVLDVLNEQRFADLAPAEVYAALLDEGALPLLETPPRRAPRHVYCLLRMVENLLQTAGEQGTGGDALGGRTDGLRADDG
jgi:hypothetical protein